MPLPQTLKRFLLFLYLLPLAVAAQINTDRVMLIGRNALYYDDYVLSIQYFNEIINAKPFLYDPYYFRAIAKFYLEDYHGAEADCSKAIDLNPFIEDSYQLRGLCRIKQDKYEDAVNDYSKVIEYKPLDQVSWYNRVLCRIHLKQYPEAVAELQTMHAKWPSYTKCYEIEAQVNLQLKDTLKADSLFAYVISKNHNNGDAWGARGMIAFSKGNYESADTLLTHAIKYSPNIPDYYINRALIRYHNKKLRDAMADYDSAINVDPQNFLAHYNRGLLRAQVSEDNLAIQDFDFVLKTEPDNLLALFNRAVLLEKTGGYRQAIKDVSKVIGEYPHFWTGYELRARCRRKIGDSKGAANDERKVFIAQLDRTFNHKRYANKSTRNRREINIEDYQKIVVEEDTNAVEKYANDYRGKVQYKKVEIKAKPMFAFSTSRESANALNSVSHYWLGLDKWNKKKTTSRPVKLTNSIKPAAQNDIDNLFADINRITQQSDSNEVHNLMACAVLYSDVKDYNSSLNCLNKIVKKDANNASAFFERAAVKQYIIEFQNNAEDSEKSHGANLLELQSVLNDLEAAEKLMPSNEYIMYNRGCAYLSAKDYNNAELFFGKAISINPKFAEAYYNRALARIPLSKKTEALADLSKAGELGLYEAYSAIKQNSKQ